MTSYSGSESSYSYDSASSLSSYGGKRKAKKKQRPPGMFDDITKKEQETAEKQDLLARFHILKSRGVPVAKSYTAKSNLNEMRLEMGRLEHENEVKESVKT